MHATIVSAMLVEVFALLALPLQAKLHKHNLTLTWELDAPNGQSREMIKMNGQMPGPTLTWDEGDDVEIWVHNRMPFNSSIHWHGLMMNGTPWSDGAVGVTQKPIEVGQSFIYRFNAYPAGTHWYHSHSRATLLDGLYGSIVIRRKKDEPRPWDQISRNRSDIRAMEEAANNPRILTISDWSHFKSWEYIAAQEQSSLSIFCVDSILVNGKGRLDCPGEDFLVNHTTSFMKYALYPSHVNDKGCFPALVTTQGRHLWGGRPEKIPLHLQKGCVPASGNREVVEADQEDGWLAISFVMAATIKTVHVSIDHHPMWVYEVDGGLIEPQLVDTMYMYAGERYSVLIKLDQDHRDYTIRVPETGLTQVINSVATLRYKGSTDHSDTKGVIDHGGRNTTTDFVQLNREHLPPYPPNAPARQADQLEILRTHRWYAPWKYTVSRGPAETGGLWAEDRGAYTPLLHDTEQDLARNESLIIRTKKDAWVDLVVQVGSHPRQPQEFPHIMHKHAQKMWQIGQAFGEWNWTSTEEAMAAKPEAFNVENPPYRDTFITKFEGTAWIALRYQAVNPGPWMFHCHIEPHMAGGMSTTILDGIDAWPVVPSEYGVDAKGFRHEDGSPHGFAWEQHNVVAFEDTCSDPDGVVDEEAQIERAWDRVVSKAMAFLKNLSSSSSTAEQVAG